VPTQVSHVCLSAFLHLSWQAVQELIRSQVHDSQGSVGSVSTRWCTLRWKETQRESSRLDGEVPRHPPSPFCAQTHLGPDMPSALPPAPSDTHQPDPPSSSLTSRRQNSAVVEMTSGVWPGRSRARQYKEAAQRFPSLLDVPEHGLDPTAVQRGSGPGIW
jgi:hypothetical protein